MLTITEDKITLTRGDSAEIELRITDSTGTIYNLQPGDKVTFTMKTSCETTAILVQKNLINNILYLEPKDTNKLDYNSYWFDIQLTTQTGKIYTVVSPHEFIVDREVNFNG